MGWRDYLAAQGATGVDYVDKVDKAMPVDLHNPPNPLNPPGEILEDVTARSDRWIVVQDGQRTENYFSELLTGAEVLARVGGESADPLINVRRPATPDEASELTRLVGAVAAFHGFTEQELAEALELAPNDPVTALPCFRSLVAEISTCKRKP